MTEKSRRHDFFNFIKSHGNTIILFGFLLFSLVTAVTTHAILYRDNQRKTSANSSIQTFVTSKTSVAEVSDTVSSTSQTTKTTTKTSTSAITSTSRSTVTKHLTSTGIVAEFPMDVNIVTYDELIQIDGIGDVTASNIIGFRSAIGKIVNMEQLLGIEGIGESKLEVLKSYLYVSDTDYQEITTTVTTKLKSNSLTTTTANSKIMQAVNINTASADEISECLLIDIKLANQIIKLRDEIGYFSNSLELLYVDGFSESMYNQCKDYILL